MVYPAHPSLIGVPLDRSQDRGDDLPRFLFAEPEFVKLVHYGTNPFDAQAFKALPGEAQGGVTAVTVDSAYSFADFGRDVSSGMVKRFRGKSFQSVNFDPAMLVLVTCSEESFLVFGYYDNQFKSNFEMLLLEFNTAGIGHDTSDANIMVKKFCCSELQARDEDDWKCFGSGLFVMEIKKGGDGLWSDFCPFPVEVMKCPEEQGMLSIWHKK